MMQITKWSIQRHCVLAVSFALTVGLIAGPADLASAQAPVNSVNYGSVIQPGSYANTPGGKTVFYNPKGLWLQGGNKITGFEVNSSSQQTGNGGTFLLKAPNNVVRLDGDINVNALAGYGRGGNVTIDATYLSQAGHIFARGGSSGGVVSINVNSATFWSGSSIDVSGGGKAYDAGGAINIKATGVVDVQGNLIANGYNSGLTTSDLITISSGLVNNLGVIRADGVSGTGGTIRLTASGGINLQPVADVLSCTKVFTPAEAEGELINLASIARRFTPETRNAIVNLGQIIADGSQGNFAGGKGGKGGTIELTSVSLFNDPNIGGGLIQANGGAGNDAGGNGGNISIKNDSLLDNYGTIIARGGDGLVKAGAVGGNGGTISVLNKTGFTNEGQGFIAADGGNGNPEQGNGGNGGTINLRTDDVPFMPNNLGILSALGGNGGTGAFGHGGNGGLIRLHNIINFRPDDIFLSGGTGGGSNGKPGILIQE